MTPIKFNANVYMPAHIEKLAPTGTIQLRWTFHALEQAAEDDFYYAPDEQVMSGARVVEMEVDGRMRPTKMVLRRRADHTSDMVMVVKRGQGPADWTVVTAYRNRRSDNHRTLRLEGVVPPPSLVVA